ncbi:MAG: methyltransferase domain-containing protein [Fibrobacteria bacterium]
MLIKGIYKIGLSGLIYPRDRLSNKYLKGTGVEVGAQSSPLHLSKRASVKYVDIVTREESIRKFPELNPKNLVNVDIVSDGFTLNGVPSGQFDFLVANHVLEHSPDPIGTVVQWLRVIKPGGILFCSVPDIEYCFDKGRAVTSYQHLLGDFEANGSGASEVLAERNKDHYREWLMISEPAILNRAVIPSEQFDKRMVEMAQSREEIHFHTFTPRSMRELFENLSGNILPGLQVLEMSAERNEIILIAKK